MKYELREEGNLMCIKGDECKVKVTAKVVQDGAKAVTNAKGSGAEAMAKAEEEVVAIAKAIN
jgi:hypothetical protein